MACYLTIDQHEPTLPNTSINHAKPPVLTNSANNKKKKGEEELVINFKKARRERRMRSIKEEKRSNFEFDTYDFFLVYLASIEGGDRIRALSIFGIVLV